MILSLKCIFLGGIFVIFLRTCVDSKNIIYQVVKGNLSHSWKFNATLLARDLKGVVLYCVDSDFNKLIIKISLELNGKTYMHLTFNNAFIRTSMKSLCGCDPCNQRSMIFYLELNAGTINIYCNKFGQHSLTATSTKDRIPKSISKIMKNVKNSIYIGMGNIDETEDLDGCLTSLYFNKTKINFPDPGTKFKSSCDHKCPDGECNQGRCSPSYPVDPVCDCSLSPLNGRYCNASLKEYIPMVNTSYSKKYYIKTIKFKLTWQNNANKTFCLMNLVDKKNQVTFIVDKGYLKIENENISPLLSEEMSYINVAMGDNLVTVQVRDRLVNVTFPTFRKYIINIGFSDNKKICETFSGKYDFFYSNSELEIWTFVKSVKISLEQIIIPIFVIMLVIFVVVVAIFIRWRRNQNKRNMEVDTKPGPGDINSDL